MYNTNFSTFTTAHTADRLICVWVPTGNPKMPLTCTWIEDKPFHEDCVEHEGTTLPDAPLHVPPSST
jgi:hypothetical protein